RACCRAGHQKPSRQVRSGREMNDIARIEEALRNADKAGDVEAAKALATHLRSLSAAPKAPESKGSFGGRLLRGVDDAVRSIASGMTFWRADEAAAGMSALTGIGGQGGGGGYEANLAAERARDKPIPPEIAIPGQIAGGVATGMGLA